MSRRARLMQRAAAMVDDFRDMIVKLIREDLAKLVVAPCVRVVAAST
jgi:hypothetical protein